MGYWSWPLQRTCIFSEWHEAKPRTSLAADMSDRRHFDLFVAFDFALGE